MKVNVLLGTYNGDEFLDEQLRSIENQEAVEVRLFVRDDGSTDETLDLLKSHEDVLDILYVEDGENVGPQESFMRLLRFAVNYVEKESDKETNLFAYADQDDIWHRNKLKKAAEALNDVGTPALFASNQNIIDSEGNFKYKRDLEFNKRIDIFRVIAGWTPSGNTLVFNYALAKKVSATRPNVIRMHDMWTVLVALSIGARFITADESLIDYRIYGGNTVGLDAKSIKYVKRLWKSMEVANIRSLQAFEVLKSHDLDIDNQVREDLQVVVRYRDNVSIKLRLIKRTDFSYLSKKQQLLFIVAVLVNKL